MEIYHHENQYTLPSNAADLFILTRTSHIQFSSCNLNSTTNQFLFLPNCKKVIATNFCTCHDSIAVMACAKFCSNFNRKKGTTAKSFFHQIQIMHQKSSVGWIPGQIFITVPSLPYPAQNTRDKCWHKRNYYKRPQTKVYTRRWIQSKVLVLLTQPSPISEEWIE